MIRTRLWYFEEEEEDVFLSLLSSSGFLDWFYIVYVDEQFRA